VPLEISYLHHSFWYLKLGNDTRNYKIWIFRSVPNSVIPISENPIYSYDSNGVFLILISSLGNEKQNLLISLFTCSFSGSPGRIWTYDMLLERYFQRGSNSIGIEGNGSVVAELLEDQVWQLGPIGGNEIWGPK